MLSGKSKAACSGCAGLMWWTTLTVAVLAVPTVGIIAALSLGGTSELGMIIAFILACWVSVWLGMWLVRKADAHHAVMHAANAAKPENASSETENS